jgi:hypothetical protein
MHVPPYREAVRKTCAESAFPRRLVFPIARVSARRSRQEPAPVTKPDEHQAHSAKKIFGYAAMRLLCTRPRFRDAVR